MARTKKNPGQTVKVAVAEGLVDRVLPPGYWAVVDENNVVVGRKAYKDEDKAKAAVLGLELID